LIDYGPANSNASFMADESSNFASAASISSPVFKRLHTYFLFPFALDKDAVQADHPQAWPDRTHWIDGLDSWIEGHSAACSSNGVAGLGQWKRAGYSEFDVDSPAYSDLLFFHSIVRHVFFDTTIGRHPDDQENQLRCYAIDLSGPRLWFEGNDALGDHARAPVTDLRLYLSADGLGVLSIGIGTGTIDAAQALWLNRRLRKLYPVDAQSIGEGRTPNWIAFRVERGPQLETICEERFEHPAMVGFYPPLPSTIKSLLELDTSGIPDAEFSAAHERVIENFLYLGHKHGDQ